MHIPSVIFLAFSLFLVPAISQGDTGWNEVTAIFQQHCILCHQLSNRSAGLRLDDHDGVLAGSSLGKIVVAGKPAESELINRVRGKSQPRMPLTGPPWLSEEEIQTLEKWIASGLPGPAEGASAPPVSPSPPPRAGAPRWGDVSAIFLGRCASCHSPNGAMGPAPEGFLAVGYKEILDASERARIVPGSPGASEVMRRIRGLSLPGMPLGGPRLDAEEIALIEAWIAAGALSDAGEPAPIPAGSRVRLGGKLTGHWELDGEPLRVSARSEIRKNPKIGERVEVRGTLTADGAVLVDRLRSR